jgi:hypothetical protein
MRGIAAASDQGGSGGAYALVGAWLRAVSASTDGFCVETL